MIQKKPSFRQKLYFDFNHDEEEASAWPTSFRWVESKGIFADVEWSDQGKAAVTGKAYRYFSPAFLLAKDEPGRPFLTARPRTRTATSANSGSLSRR